MVDPATADPFQPYAAPSGDHSALIDPPLSGFSALLHANRQRLSASGELAGHDWTHWRAEARAELGCIASAYTSAYRDAAVAPVTADTPLLLAGHQPELFHPGVWFKNFVLSACGRQHRATAINLVVDNDLSRLHSIRAPARDTVAGLHVAQVELDLPSGGRPIEEARLVDRSLFDSFGDRLTKQLMEFVERPIVGQLWPLAIEASRRSDRLGWILAEARHRYEGRCGLQTLEVPLSQICQTHSFARFVAVLCEDAPRLQDCYHTALNTYREAHRIRSRSHPVPNLGRREDWYEVPLWTYSAIDPRRHAVWVRRVDGRLTLSDLLSWELNLPARDAASALHEQLVDGQQRLRPRALITTMYARLILSDLFVHGIGGGKYDQLNDMLIRSFLGVDPPGFAVATATLRLPGAPDLSLARQRVRDFERRLRDLRFAPERLWIDRAVPSALTGLLAQKSHLLRQQPIPTEKRRWHEEICEVNRQIASAGHKEADQLRTDLQDARAAERDAEILGSREFAFCCHPAGPTEEWLDRLSTAVESSGSR